MHGFDVDNNRSLLIYEQEVRHVPTHSPINRCFQQKRLRNDAVHRSVEIRIQQPRQFQTRLIDHMRTFGRRPVRAE